MWELVYKGKRYGEKFESEAEAVQAYVKLHFCMNGISYRKVREGV
ncbi:hypothetical protein [Paenibacillus sp. y28]